MASLTSDDLPKDEMLREATVDDYQAVLDIEQNVYMGHDYLASTFSSLVEGLGVRGYVFEKENKVVGFLSTRLVDGGQTMLTMAGRVHSDYRGAGVFGRFKKAVLKRFESSPNLRNEVFAVNNVTMDEFSQRLRNYSLVMKKAVTTVEVDVDQIKAELSAGPVHATDHLQPLTPHHLHSMLSRTPSHLFPQQRILLHWEPFKILPDNADHIANSCRDHLLVASAGELAAVDKGDNFPVSLMSSGSYYRCQRGILYEMDVFGSGSDEEVCKHLVWHLQRAVRVAKEKRAIIRVFADKRVDDAVGILQEQFPLLAPAWPLHDAFVLEAPVNQKRGTEISQRALLAQ